MSKKILILSYLIVFILNALNPTPSTANDVGVAGGALLGGSLLLLEIQKQERAKDKTRLKVKEWREKQELLKQQHRFHHQTSLPISPPTPKQVETPKIERENPSLNKSEQEIILKLRTAE